MSRKSSRIAVLIGAVLALCQVSRAQVVPGGAVQGGTTILLSNGPTTPVITYAAPPPTAGITNAGRAGISNYEPVPTVLPGQSDTVVYVSQPGVQPVAIAPVVTQVGTTTAPATTSGAAETVAAPESAGKTFNDFVPSAYVHGAPGAPGATSAGSGGAASSASLGEISAQFKARKASNNGRVLSNQDVQQMLGGKTGVTVAKNMPPLERGAMPAGGAETAAAQPSSSGNTIAQASSPTGQGGTPATPPGQGSTTGRQAGTPPPTDTSQQQPAGAEAAAGSTTPAVNRNQQSNDARGKSKLPATATMLPLLGLLGVVSGGIGLWYRRFRK